MRGYYVNPRDESKEAFLAQHGIEVLRTFRWSDLPSGCLPVVLVDNGPFTAAAICYSEKELAEFTRTDDRRPRTIFVVKIKDLLPVAGRDFQKYAAANLLT